MESGFPLYNQGNRISKAFYNLPKITEIGGREALDISVSLVFLSLRVFFGEHSEFLLIRLRILVTLMTITWKSMACVSTCICRVLVPEG
jgi:hypothetical protein